MSEEIRDRAEALSGLDAVIAAEVVARRMVTEHMFEDFLCCAKGQNTTGNGIDVTSVNTVTLVDYGVLKERARVVGILKASLGVQGDSRITMFSGRMHWTSELTHTVADFIDLIVEVAE